LKSSTIIGSLPFIFVMFLSAFALVKDLAHEKAEVTLKAPAPAAQPVPQEVKVKTDF
jgi:choline-glycine betaine transporter